MMETGRVHWMGSFAMRLLRVVLVGSLLLLNTSNSVPEVPYTLYHDEPAQPLSGESFAAHSYSLAVSVYPSGEAIYRLLADVVVDEEFVEQVGEGWKAEVEEIVAEANRLLRPAGLAIEVASIQQWRSDDGVDSIGALLQDSETQVQRTPGHLLLAITCQDTVKYDGWAQESRNGIITRFYHVDRERTPALVAHELGHVLGAHHHAKEEECTEEGCIMDERGYAYATQWCEHHIEVVQGRLQSLVVAQ